MNGEYITELEELQVVAGDILKENKCKKCNILPLCLGGCPYNVMIKGQKNECDAIKYNLESILMEYYNFLHHK